MAKNASEQTEEKKKQPITVENAVANKPKQGGKSLLVWLAVLILLGVSAALYWLIEQQKAEVANLTEEMASSTVQLDSKLAEIKQSLNRDTASIQQRLENLNSTDVGLAEKIAEIAKIQDMTNDDVKRVWTMAEVEYLLQTANQRAQLAEDAEGARQALILADEKLKQLADPRLYRLRAMLSDEQLALAAVKKVDIDGLAVRLQSAIDHVNQLQVLLAPEVKTEGDVSPETTAMAPDWKSALLSAWEQVRSLVVIRHQEDGAAAVLVPEERYFLYQNLRLKLETARAALLQKRETVFHDSLASAEKWLQQYFIGEERDAVLTSVQALNSEQIVVELPDISGSLAWLQQNGDVQ